MKRDEVELSFSPLLTSRIGDNSALIKDVADFYLKDGMTVADVTYGKGVFWRQVDVSKFDFRPTDLQQGVDFGNLPYEDRSVDVVVLDPPYMHGGETVKSSINDCYKNKNTSHESVVRLYTKGILEAARVLKKGGQLWMKTQDEIESGKQRLTSHETRAIAEMTGFSVKDLFVLTQQSVPAMRESYQKTARKNHSYLFILEFRR